MKKITIDKIEFESNINLDDGYKNNPLGIHKSTMELFKIDDKHYEIEWDIPTLEETEHIGIYIDENKNVTGYDGVFELPEQAITMLEKNGFNCNEVKN